MILRTALAVAVTVALFAVSLPAIETARVDAANARVETALERIDDAAVRLAARNDPTSGPGARLTITVTLPTRSWGRAGLDSIRLPADPEAPVRWRVAGGAVHAVEPSAPLVGGTNGSVLETGGGRRLTLELRERDDRPVVAVSRPDV